MIETLSRLTKSASDLLLKAAAAGLVGMTAIVGYQVFGRYVLNSSPSWSEQGSLTLMIWYVSFAAAAGVREGFHIRITAVEDAASPNMRRLLRCSANGVVAVCGLAMAVWGGDLVVETWSHVIPSLGLPRGFAYLGLPISGILIALFSLERMLEEAVKSNVEASEDPRWS